MSFFNRVKPLTPEVAHKLTEKTVNPILTGTVSKYVHERFQWLLRDLHQGESSYLDPKIAQQIHTFVEREISSLSYDDAKEMAIAIATEDRFTNSNNPAARQVLVSMISEAMKEMTLGAVKCNPKTGTRRLHIIR